MKFLLRWLFGQPRTDPKPKADSSTRGTPTSNAYSGPNRRSGVDRRDPAPTDSQTGLRRNLTGRGRRKTDKRR
jgi:hypothetical protein